MKKNILLLLVLLYAGVMNAQTFEGIVKWSIESEVTDPEAKAKMEEAQRKMKDPAAQAKMKEMKDKMDNDPQFKKMMESNPQMKAQMEAMMKAQEGDGDMMSSMMPKSFMVMVKGPNTVTKMEGGIMGNMEILYLKDKNQSYRIDRPSKTYSVLPNAATKMENEGEVKVTKTNEKIKVLNYTCTKYIIETTHKGQVGQQIFWTTTEIKDFDLKSMAHQRAGDGSSWYFDKVDGVPLKMEIAHPQGKMIMTAVEIKKQSLPATDFAIPAGFKEVHTPGYGK
jgi:hypothetical protein